MLGSQHCVLYIFPFQFQLYIQCACACSLAQSFICLYLGMGSLFCTLLATKHYPFISSEEHQTFREIGRRLIPQSTATSQCIVRVSFGLNYAPDQQWDGRHWPFMPQYSRKATKAFSSHGSELRERHSPVPVLVFAFLFRQHAIFLLSRFVATTVDLLFFGLWLE